MGLGPGPRLAVGHAARDCAGPEGVKAALVEKRPPVWSPSRLEQVTEADVAGAFRPPEGGDLSF